MSSEPSKNSGQFHSLKGSVVEAIGNLTGSQSWQESGKQERASGDAGYEAAQTQSYTEGTGDRVQARAHKH